MPSKYAWKYFLIVPSTAIAAANAVSAALNNPNGVEKTFRRYPLADDASNYLLPATHYAATFLAPELSVDGLPSKQALEEQLARTLDFAAIYWIRSKNPWHLNTLDEEKGVVMASNWPAFPPGSTVSWDAVSAAIAAL